MKKQYLIIAASLLVATAGSTLLAQDDIDDSCNCDPPPTGCTLVSSSCGPNPYGGTLTTCNYSCPTVT